MSYPITYLFVEFNTRQMTSTPFSKVASHNSSFLNDVVVDMERCVAYISDAQAVDGAIIVVDMDTHTSARFSSAATQRDPSYVSHIYVKPHRCGASENYDRTSIPHSSSLRPFLPSSLPPSLSFPTRKEHYAFIDSPPQFINSTPLSNSSFMANPQ